MANVTGAAEAAKNVAVKKAEETKAAVKTAAKAVETKAEEVKAEVKAEAEKVVAAAKTETAPAKKEEAPAVEEKAAGKKPGRKPGSKSKTTKAAAKKEEAVTEVYVQFGPGESSVNAVIDKIKAEYVEQGHRASSIKTLNVYLKPEDRSAYYVINDKVAGRVDLF